MFGHGFAYPMGNGISNIGMSGYGMGTLTGLPGAMGAVNGIQLQSPTTRVPRQFIAGAGLKSVPNLKAARAAAKAAAAQMTRR